MNDRMVWIDCEMTGLDLARDALVEVAVLVTDCELNVLGEGIDLVIQPPADALEQMPDVVRDMHTASGLLDALEAEHGIPLADAEEQVLAYVRSAGTRAAQGAPGGNTVCTDRGFLARDMPALEAHLHYRIIDVSSIKELARRWYPRAYFASPPKYGGHRALADIREASRSCATTAGGVRSPAGPGLRNRPRDRGAVRRPAGRPLPTSAAWNGGRGRGRSRPRDWTG